MIFAVAGSQLKFPRLMDALHEIAPELPDTVFAQTADPKFASDRITHAPFLAPDQFERKLEAASVIVAHAGIGILIAASNHRKPLVVMPRRAALSEHRNDHQLATAGRFRHLPGLSIVHDQQELMRVLAGPLVPMGERSNPLSDQLFSAIQAELA